MVRIASIARAREKREAAKHRKNRLLMLMHEFLDAEDRGDTDHMRMVGGRGLSTYTRVERNEAYAEALAARPKKPEEPQN